MHYLSNVNRRLCCRHIMLQTSWRVFMHSPHRFATVRAFAAAGAAVNSHRNKEALVNRLLTAKEETGKTFSDIAQETGLTNAYAAQLLYNQAQLKPGSVEKFAKAVPGITKDDLAVMQKVPFRSYNSEILKEPLVYRLQEAVHHYAEAIHAIVAEECGDGIMSAIDMFGNVDVIKGKQGEARIHIQLNGKFLPHIEQLEENNTAPRPSQQGGSQ